MACQYSLLIIPLHFVLSWLRVFQLPVFSCATWSAHWNYFNFSLNKIRFSNVYFFRKPKEFWLSFPYNFQLFVDEKKGKEEKSWLLSTSISSFYQASLTSWLSKPLYSANTFLLLFLLFIGIFLVSLKQKVASVSFTFIYLVHRLETTGTFFCSFFSLYLSI